MSVPDIVPESLAPSLAAIPEKTDSDPRSCDRATDGLLASYLNRLLPPEAMNTIRAHLDACERCWNRWNRHRWNAAAHHPLHTQLAEFLGPRWQPYFDSSKALADEWDAADPRTDTEIARFFRSSHSYLINLTIWEASGNRPPYVAAALTTLQQHGIQTILDIGCGIGSDAIALHNHGFTITGCDYHSPSTQFMHRRTGGSIPVVEPSELNTMPPPDALWIIDTIDHIPDIHRSLGTVLSKARLMVTEDLTGTRKHGRQRFHHRRTYNELAELFGHYGFESSGHDGTCQYWAGKPA